MNANDYNIKDYTIRDIYNLFDVSDKTSIEYIKVICKEKKELAKEHLEENDYLILSKFIDDSYKLLASIREQQYIRNEPDRIHSVNNKNQCNYKINPITPSTIKQIISIDSLFRENYETTSSTDFIFKLPNEFTNVISMKLTSAEIPNTFYLINEGMNVFRITIKDTCRCSDNETHFDITIPPGTWSADNLVDFLQNYFDHDNDTDLRYLIITLNEQTGKLIFRFKTPAEIDSFSAEDIVDLDPDKTNTLEYKIALKNNTYLCKNDYETSKNLLYIMGFHYSQYNIFISSLKTFLYGRTLILGYLEAYYVYAHCYSSYFYICIDEFITNTKEQIIAFKKDQMLSESILGRIQIKNQPFTVNIDNNNDNVFKERNYFGNIKIRKLHVKVIDKYGNILNLNNSEISLALELTQSYCSENQHTFNKSLFLSNNI